MKNILSDSAIPTIKNDIGVAQRTEKTYTITPTADGVLNIVDPDLGTVPTDGLVLVFRTDAYVTAPKISLNGGAAVAINTQGNGNREAIKSIEAYSVYEVVFFSTLWRLIGGDGTGYSFVQKDNLVVSNDTPTGWGLALGGKGGFFFGRYNIANRFPSQKNQWGYLETICGGENGSDIYQRWHSQPNGPTFERAGNNAGWDANSSLSAADAWTPVLTNHNSGIAGNAIRKNNQDLNNLDRSTGVYACSNVTNGPWQDTWMVFVLAYDSNQVTQIAKTVWSNASIYMRSRYWSNSDSAFIWTSWTKVLVDANPGGGLLYELIGTGNSLAQGATINLSNAASKYRLILVTVSASPYDTMSAIAPAPSAGTTYGTVMRLSGTVNDYGINATGGSGPGIRAADVTVRVNDTTANLIKSTHEMIKVTTAAESAATGQMRSEIYSLSSNVRIYGIR